MATATKTRWHMSGQGYEFCNCDFGCGCNFGGFPNSKDGRLRAAPNAELFVAEHSDHATLVRDPAPKYGGRYLGFRESVRCGRGSRILSWPGAETIQSSPEVAQTRLAYGRFLAADDPAASGQLIERAIGLFEAMGAAGWVTEARAAL